jgi:hypothetical protein
MAMTVDQPGDEKKLIATDSFGFWVPRQKVFVGADSFNLFPCNSNSATVNDRLIMGRDQVARSHQHGYLGHENSSLSIIDGLVRSPKSPFSVIPAKAGIQFIHRFTKYLDSDFHRSDDFLRGRQ